uniref:Uncharacterized protein n=1 Tax=Pipistrellus kuhlii TaxID=59472 RepID=A0A7J7YN81_PIPKU|nr:hypothetical protein mPipKuh1_014550 [Pipistrellus kuhlii]
MARTPGPKFSLFLPPLAVLLVCVCAAPGASGRRDSHSLHYDFNISSDKQPWCMVQEKMDEEKYLFYDCGNNKVIYINLPREEGKAIHSCKGELGTLSNMGNELKPLLADIKREKYADGAAPTTVPATATTTPTIASAAPTKTTVMLETLAILLIVLVISFILIIIRICYSNRKRWQKMLLKSSWKCGLVQRVSLLLGCLSTSSSAPDGPQELQSFQQIQRPAGGQEDSEDAMFRS